MLFNKPYYKEAGYFCLFAALAVTWLPLSVIADDSENLVGNVNNVVSDGESNPAELVLIGRGERLLSGATTDVWSLGNYAYMGTFASPCGDGTGANGSGIRIFDVSNPALTSEVGNVPSQLGSRSNDVKIAAMNSGSILVHSNEVCDGGPGGFEVYNMDNPLTPVHLAHVQVDDISKKMRKAGEVDGGVHNLFLFTQGDKDYAAAVVGSTFGNFQIFDISNPAHPKRVGYWGAEQIALPQLGFAPNGNSNAVAAMLENAALNGNFIRRADAWLTSPPNGGGSNGFLHDITISDDGTMAYLSNWDAGLVLLDISDVTNPQLVSAAVQSEHPDGSIVSHAAWPTADGSVVVETSEDFFIKEPGANPLDIPTPSALRYTPGPGTEMTMETVDFNAVFDPLFGPETGIGLDASVEVPFAAGFPYLGETHYSVFVNSSGNVTLGEGVVGYTPTALEFAEQAPRMALFWADLDPRAASVHAEDKGDRLVITFNQMPYFADSDPSTTTTAQLILQDDGVIEMAYLEIDPAIEGDGATAVIGVSAGIEDSGASFIDITTGLPRTDNLGAIGELFSNLEAASLWGHVRIWDHSDPSNPVLASTFDTVCSANPFDESCELDPTYSVHNVIVEGDIAYIAWYGNGVLAVDISDPYYPVEIARYNPTDAAFETQNGGIQDVWGIYKIPGEPNIYASDRHGGLYILKLVEE
jgi:hypothetical protein